MCGIAALFSSDPLPLDNLIQSMTTAVRHRGPDGEGFAIFSARGFATTVLGGVDTPVRRISAPGLHMLPYGMQNRFPMPSLPSATTKFDYRPHSGWPSADVHF